MRQDFKKYKLIILSGFVVSMMAYQSPAGTGKKSGKVNDAAAAAGDAASETYIKKEM